jgi:hypothetical protein
MSSWLERLKKNPTDWLLEKSCPPLQYRTLTEILDRPQTDPAVMRAREGANNFKPAVTISRAQKESGIWLDKVIEFEAPNNSRNRGPGMVNQFLALLEFGWDRSHPIVHCSAERLFRYLAEDPEADLFELKGYAGTNKASNVTIRRSLSVISAALLARGGYADDPNVGAVAERVLAELSQQYPENGAPDLYDGTMTVEEEGTYRRIRPGMHIPDMFLYYLLAFHPRFTADASARAVLQRVTDHLLQGDEIPMRVREAEGRRFLRLVDLHIGNWNEAEYGQGRIGFLLHDLELLARTGTLADSPKAMRLLDWLLSLQDPADGVFRADPQIEKVMSRSQYHYFPLEDSWRGKHKKYTDVTFRTMLILRCLDRTSPLA